MGTIHVFSQRLRSLRIKAEMTQAELAAEIGVKAATISAYENADESKRATPSLENACAIARFFNVSLDYLCGIENEKRESKEENVRTFLRNITLFPSVDFRITYDPIITAIPGSESWPKDWDIRDETIGYSISYKNNRSFCRFMEEWQAVRNLRESGTFDDATYNGVLDILINKYTPLVAKEIIEFEPLPF